MYPTQVKNALVTLATYFTIAILSFTRIPIPHNWIKFEEREANKSMAFFPLVGGLIGLLCWVIWFYLQSIIPSNLLILILLAIPIIFTGAYHEDGFADVCDSYGGYTKEKMLDIMKDSRIGAFAGVGVVFLILAKYILLSDIKFDLVPLAIISAMVIGRFTAMLPFRIFSYIGKTQNNSHMLAFSFTILLAALFISFLILSIFIGIGPTLIILPITQCVILLSAAYFNNKYGGLTGDTGGAMEQIGEVTVYFLFLFISNGTIPF